MNPTERIRVGDRITIFQRGKKKTWCADFWRDGEHQRQSLKTANKKVAIERATKLAATLVDGTFHRPLPTVTIMETVDNYLKFLKTEDRAPKTLVKYRGVFNTFVSFLDDLGVTRMTQVSPTHYDKFRAFRKQDHHAKTMYTEGVIIKQLFRWAKKCKLINENPLEEIKLSKPKLTPKPGPELNQINMLLDESRGKMQMMLAMLAFTGIRSGELQRLRREDVDLTGNWIHIVSRPGAETKNRSSRKIPIHARLRQILAKWPISCGLYFTAEPSAKYPGGGHCISTKKLNERFGALLSKLNLPKGRAEGFTIHSLRHSFETICINAGIPQRVVDAWQGHSSDQSMGAVYYRLADLDSQAFMVKVPFGTGKSAANAGAKEAI